MLNSSYKSKIRSVDIYIDTQFEEEIGVYGRKFWDGISSGEYESDTFDFIELCVQRGSKAFVDVGSATGCMVLYASALNMSVIGTEPQNLVFEGLQRNLRLNPQLAEKVEIMHCLITSTGDNSNSVGEYFTPGASGPLERAINPLTVSLKSIIDKFRVEDKVALKVDIEGAELPLLSDVKTLNSLCEKKALMYLSFHPGFRRSLSPNPWFLEHFLWRLLTLFETIRFVARLRKYAQISLISSDSILRSHKVIWKIIQGRRDFVLQF